MDNALLVQALNTKSHLQDDLSHVVLGQWLPLLFDQIVKEITCLHPFSHDEEMMSVLKAVN